MLRLNGTQSLKANWFYLNMTIDSHYPYFSFIMQFIKNFMFWERLKLLQLRVKDKVLIEMILICIIINCKRLSQK
jgi:hypothetical protein